MNKAFEEVELRELTDQEMATVVGGVDDDPIEDPF